jgi:hypothetical protein
MWRRSLHYLAPFLLLLFLGGATSKGNAIQSPKEYDVVEEGWQLPPMPSTITPTPYAPLLCGDDGPRVLAFYVRSADDPSQLEKSLPLFLSTLAEAEQIFFQSLGMRVRFLSSDETPCSIIIQEFVVAAGQDDSFGEIVGALEEAGYALLDQKYLIFADSTFVCGISSIWNDSSPDANNKNNRQPSYAIIGSGCWYSGWVAAHELGHAFGAVQLDAPHATGTWHCSDDYDIMCYDSIIVCGEVLEEYLFDCNDDDYAAALPLRSGGYLAEHWNMANSQFLYKVHRLYFPFWPRKE